MKFLLLIFTIFALQSCECGCEEPNPPKHQFKIGEIVHHRLDTSKTFIIQDTVREECAPEYVVENSDGDRIWLLEVNIKK